MSRAGRSAVSIGKIANHTQTEPATREELLLRDYQALRDDERYWITSISALLGFTAAFGAAVADRLYSSDQTALLKKDWPRFFLPLLIVIALSYAGTGSSTAVLRSFYMRRIELELRNNMTVSGRRKDDDVTPMSFIHLSHYFTSTKVGPRKYRFVLFLLWVPVIALCIGISVSAIFGIQNISIKYSAILLYSVVVWVFLSVYYDAALSGWKIWNDASSHMDQMFQRTVARGSEADASFDFSYFLLPRKQEVVKSLFPIVIALGLSRSQYVNPDYRVSVMAALYVLFLFEFLGYQGRYVWNDLRDRNRDSNHRYSNQRHRLQPGRGGAITGFASLASRILLLAPGLYFVEIRIRTQVGFAVTMIFIIGILYEGLKEHLRKTHKTGCTVPTRISGFVELIVAVGFGYGLRCWVGIIVSGAELPTILTVLLVFFMSAFGSVFVSQTWTLEATSFSNTADEYAGKPHCEFLLANWARSHWKRSTVRFGEGSSVFDVGESDPVLSKLCLRSVLGAFFAVAVVISIMVFAIVTGFEFRDSKITLVLKVVALFFISFVVFRSHSEPQLATIFKYLIVFCTIEVGITGMTGFFGLLPFLLLLLVFTSFRRSSFSEIAATTPAAIAAAGLNAFVNLRRSLLDICFGKGFHADLFGSGWDEFSNKFSAFAVQTRAAREASRLRWIAVSSKWPTGSMHSKSTQGSDQFEIDIRRFVEESKARTVVVDLDNTLRHFGSDTLVRQRSETLQRLQSEGIKVVIFSNGRADPINSPFEIVRRAKKPFTNLRNGTVIQYPILVLGDQLITDGALAWRTRSYFIYCPLVTFEFLPWWPKILHILGIPAGSILKISKF